MLLHFCVRLLFINDTHEAYRSLGGPRANQDVSGRLTYPTPIATDPMPTSQIGSPKRPPDAMHRMTRVKLEWAKHANVDEQAPEQRTRRP